MGRKGFGGLTHSLQAEFAEVKRKYLWLMDLVSIIVPVYNVERYLRRCLDSIVAQTYKNIEVILVDDESPDKCGQICDEYAAEHPCIKVIHQKNMGLSGARNSGARNATGDYVTFVDSDDFITSDYVEYLLNLIKRYDSDVSVARFVYQYDNKPIKERKTSSHSECLTPTQALKRMNYNQGLFVMAWAKMYKRELVLRYPYPVGRIYEDVATTYKIIGDSQRVAYGSTPVYYWVQRVESIMHAAFNEKQYDAILSVSEQLNYIQEKFPEAEDAAKFRYAAKCVELLSASFQSGVGRQHYKRLAKYASPFIWDVIKDPNAKRSIKIRLFSMWLGYLPAKYVFLAHEKLKRRYV